MRIFLHKAQCNFSALISFARLSFRPDEKSDVPEQKNRFVQNPEDAPKTIVRNRDYPDDFHLYTFAGPMIEQVRYMGDNGEEMRCPALVARMVRKTEFTQGTMIGASSMEEMTCSIRDLRTYKNDEEGISGHPDADKIARDLAEYYENKVASKQREAGIKEIDFIHLTSHTLFDSLNKRGR